METKEVILTQIHQYLQKFPLEKEEVNPLIQFVNEQEGQELFNRKNFIGHITTSAFIVDENRQALLLLKHKALNRWLQPGGHVDTSDVSLKDAALREAIEETGLNIQQLELLSDNIFDVDSHHIPANPRKQEPAHTHHDLRFLFQCSHPLSLNISMEESTEGKWIPFLQLKDNADFFWVQEKLKGF